MTSEAKAAANRTNSAHSTGPRTPQGKARTCRNSFRHGFSVASGESFDQIRQFAAAIAVESRDPAMLPAAEDFVSAELELNRIRQHRSQSINRKVADWLARCSSSPLSSGTYALIYWGAVVSSVSELGALLRYERRAWSRRKRALRALIEGRNKIKAR